jgi:hypothetical protein
VVVLWVGLTSHEVNARVFQHLLTAIHRLAHEGSWERALFKASLTLLPHCTKARADRPTAGIRRGGASGAALVERRGACERGWDLALGYGQWVVSGK